MGLITGLEIVSRVLRVQGVTSLSAMFDQTALLFRHALNTTNDRACPLLITVLQDMLKSCDISSPDGLPKEVRDLMEVLQREMHRTIQATQDSFSAYIEKLQASAGARYHRMLLPYCQPLPLPYRNVSMHATVPST